MKLKSQWARKQLGKCELKLIDLMSEVDMFVKTLENDGNNQQAKWLQDNQATLETLFDYFVAMRSANNGQDK
jgi:hypothetical protein